MSAPGWQPDDLTVRAFADAISVDPERWEDFLDDYDWDDLTTGLNISPAAGIETSREVAERVLDRHADDPRFRRMDELAVQGGRNFLYEDWERVWDQVNEEEKKKGKLA